MSTHSIRYRLKSWNSIRNQTGITDEVLAKAPYAYQAANMLYDFIGDYPLIVGHNFAKFDAKFIDKLYSMAGLLFNCRIIDTLNLFQRVNSQWKPQAWRFV